MKPVVLFAGAPSGGHLYPGLALAARLREAGDCETHFLTSGGPLETAILAEAGQSAHRAPSPRPRSPLQWWHALRAVRRVFADLRPHAFVGLGGAPSLLPGWVAAGRRCPVFLLEQNRVLGRANRWLAPVARRLFLSYPDTDGGKIIRRRGLVVGCPVRAAFEPANWVAARSSRPQVLVLGGSQGAKAVNDLCPLAFARLSESLRAAVRVLHVAGDGKAIGLREEYQRSGVEAEVVDYLADPAPALAASALVVGRAGGSTLAELTALGRGALLLPYPHHRDRQQFLNASWLEAGGAARVCAEDPGHIATALAALLSEPGTLETMASCAQRLGRADAANQIATIILTHLDALPAHHPVVRGEAVAA
ncbi:MAG: glycosyltransferase [Planctomycetota bacterium]